MSVDSFFSWLGMSTTLRNVAKLSCTARFECSFAKLTDGRTDCCVVCVDTVLELETGKSAGKKQIDHKTIF